MSNENLLARIAISDLERVNEGLRFLDPNDVSAFLGDASLASLPGLIRQDENVGVADSDAVRLTVDGLLLPAFESLSEILAEVNRQYPSVYQNLNENGSWVIRSIADTSIPSLHSWGLAVDFQICGQDDVLHDDYSFSGFADIFPIFNDHGWNWGGGFPPNESGSREDSLHFEVARDTFDAWMATPGLLTAPSAVGIDMRIPAAVSIPLSQLFQVSPDPGDTLAFFNVRDRDVGGGYLTLSGVPQPEGVVISDQPINAIDQWAFVAGNTGSVDHIGFNVIDSHGAYSSPSAVATVTAITSVNIEVILSGFGGPEGFGELSQGRNDDRSSNQLDLPFNIDFFGQEFDQFYVNNNGNITFIGPLSTYTPNPFPVANQPMIAPFWADVDTRPADGGEVYVAAPNQSTVVVTWNEVGYFADRTDLKNTFQLVLRDRPDTGDGNFDVEFRYGQLQWTTGDASGGSGGLGGVPAQAGFDAGDLTNFLTLPGSRTGAALNWDDTGNTSPVTPGLWTFAIRNGSLPGGTPANPLMPVVIDDNFSFDFNIGDTSRPVFIDPVVAIGYDYAITSGPSVSSVILPTGIGDNLFDLWEYDAGTLSYSDSGIDLTGGVQYDFGTPVSNFRILGIETSAELDPDDPLAFVTGLYFASTGPVTMTMSPVRFDTDPSLSIRTVEAEKAEGDSGTTTFSFEVTRSGDLHAGSTVEYVLAGIGADPADSNDFVGGVSGNLVFSANEASQIITVNVAGDTVVEADEGFSITLSNPTSAAIAVGVASSTILNDDQPLPELRATVSFAVMSDRGDAMADGVVDFGSETTQPSSHIQHQALMAIQGDGDQSGEAGETGVKLSGMGYGGRVNSLVDDNDAGDPVLITGHGRVNNGNWGDLTGAVRFANDRGFGLDNGPDGEPAAKFLNGGDSLTFDVGSIGQLGKVTFTVNAKSTSSGADVRFDADGDILTSGARNAGGGLDDFALNLGLVTDGTEVCIDLMARQISFTAADGETVSLDETSMQPLLDEFAAAGADQITIGSRIGEGFAIQDLQLEVWSDFLVG